MDRKRSQQNRKTKNQIDRSIVHCLRRKKRPVIIDVGAYVGLYSLKINSQLRHTFPTFHMLECCRRNFNELNKNTQSEKRFHRHYIALADKNGKTAFYWVNNDGKDGSSESNSLYKDFLANKPWVDEVHKDSVRCMTLDKFLDSNKVRHVDLLKLNCEGCEYKIFDAPTLRFLKKTDMIYLMLHGKSKQFLTENYYEKRVTICNILSDHGFHMVAGDNINKCKKERDHIRQLWRKPR